MTALDLYRQGELNGAIKVLGEELRSNPLDTKRRTFLFELLCFAGNFDRAEKQLDLLADANGKTAAGALMYRSALHAERTRQELFEKKRYPEARATGEPVGGRWNGQAFTELRDADPRIGANLEVFIAGGYTWIPMRYMERLEVEKPVALRDLLWATARVEASPAFRLQDLGEVLIPVLSPFSARHADGAVQLGRTTVWEQVGDESEVPLGQRMLWIDGEEVPLLEIRSIEWDQPEVEVGPKRKPSMPLREDLLEPIAGDNPSGANLYYDKVFDQIKEARTEDVEVGSAGAWERAAKKADHVAVIKLAGETLAKRSKDLRLAGWLAEAHLRREGITLLAPGLELIWKLQDIFWDTLYPEIDEDGTLDLRVSAIEASVTRLGLHLRNAPVTKAGHSATQYSDSRRLGYEAAADTSEKQQARQDAIDHGQLTAEDFDVGFEATKKAFYVEAEASLESAAVLIAEVTAFHEEKYGDDYPNLNKLTTAVTEVKQIVAALLNEKRKTEPDAVVAAEPEPEPVHAVEEEPEPEPVYGVAAVAPQAPAPKPVAKAAGFSGIPTTAEQAYAAILAGAMFLQEENPLSPVPYLVCAGLRLGQTRQQGAHPSSDFAIAPPTETRQMMRRLANEASWAELMKLCLRTLTEPCGRAWLDLHRYIWRAAKELGADATATALVATVSGTLKDLPEMREWTLDDDTPVGNAETQQWIDTEILPPPPQFEESPPVDEPVSFSPVLTEAQNGNAAHAPEIYDTAMELLQHGKPGEAIRLLVRDAELQPSGRKRFKRRVQVAQLCLLAEQDAVAYPVLRELSDEMERRGLETWEAGEMLAHPLSLLLTCMERRNLPPETREVIFERICRLDPQAALAVQH